jgi:hypothetical protein
MAHEEAEGQRKVKKSCRFQGAGCMVQSDRSFIMSFNKNQTTSETLDASARNKKQETTNDLIIKKAGDILPAFCH